MITRPAMHALLCMAGTILLTATVVAAIPGAPADARDQLAFTFHPPPASPGTLAGILAANLPAAGLPLLAAAFVTHTPPTLRAGLDLLVLVVLVPNMLLIGVAVGAYGPRLAAYLTHLPLELAGLAIAAGAYLHARRPTDRSAWTLAGPAAVAASCLLLAAVIETYTPPT